MKQMLFIAVLLLTGPFPVALRAAEFRASAEKADITPQKSYDLWGYSNRTGPATGMLDPLYAKILVLDDGTTRLALVTLDLGRPFGDESMNIVRKRVKESAGIKQVFFCASHTHSGPVIDDSYEPGKRPEWETDALEKIGAGIGRAAGKLAGAKIGTGAGETFIGHNRRFVRPDGSVKMLWRNVAKIPTRPVDPWVGVIRIDDHAGKPVAILVNYSCHPVVLGPDNLQYSSDYSGNMTTYVENHVDGNPVCLFLQGGAGDINPFYDKMALREDGVRLMRETSQQLGKEVVRVAASVETRTPAKPSLQYALQTRRFKSRWDTDKVVALLKARLKPELFARYRKYLEAPLDCPVMSLLINDEIALMGMPGEPFVDFATGFRARSPVKSSFFVGYANGYRGYFPTIEAAVAGGYGADSVGARAEVGAGETMLNMAVVQLHKLLGRLPSVPAR